MSVGVLALQGSFHEHMAALGKLGVNGVLVKKPEQLEGLVGLIIPGGESTTMARLAEYHNLIQALQDFYKKGKPIWGTCAGLIFLASKAIGQKSGGQELIGGLDCTVHRNFFGSQPGNCHHRQANFPQGFVMHLMREEAINHIYYLNSFETELPVPKIAAEEGGPETFRAVFIRAPAILEAGPSVEVLAEYTLLSKESTSTIENMENEGQCQAGQKVIVAVKQGNLLATAFHPELTSDTRWHSYFLKMLGENEDQSLVPVKVKQDPENSVSSPRHRDLPIFQQTEVLSFEQ